ncbi:hypothetical protein D3C71_1120520 [compost metagenome]
MKSNSVICSDRRPASATDRVCRSSTSRPRCSTCFRRVLNSVSLGGITPSQMACKRPRRTVNGVRSSCDTAAAVALRSRSSFSRESVMWLKSRTMSASSPLSAPLWARTEKSPSAMRRAASVTDASGSVTNRDTQNPVARPNGRQTSRPASSAHFWSKRTSPYRYCP